jgi:hypothetical protein
VSSFLPALDYIEIDEVCRIIGGEKAPVHPSTYYRGVASGIYPPPDHPSPGISRVNRPALIAALRGRSASATAPPVPDWVDRLLATIDAAENREQAIELALCEAGAFAALPPRERELAHERVIDAIRERFPD